MRSFAGVCRLEPRWKKSWTSLLAFSFSRSDSNRTLFVSSSTMKPATLRPSLPRPAIRRRILIHRNYAVQAPGSPTLQVFDRHAKYLQKERAAANVERSRQVDYLKDEVAIRLSERLLVSWLVSIDVQRLTLGRTSIDVSTMFLTSAQILAT